MGVGPLFSAKQGIAAFALRGPREILHAFWRSTSIWLSSCAASDRDRLNLWLPVGLGAGIGVYFWLPFEPPAIIAATMLFAGFLVGLAAIGSESRILRTGLAALAATAIGFGVAKHRMESLEAPVLSHRIGAAVIEARVDDAEAHGKGTRALLTLASIEHLRRERLPRRARVSFRGDTTDLEPGDWIRLKAVLLPPPDPAEPGDYDFGRAAFFRQIGAVGYAFGKPDAISSQFPPALRERISIAIALLRWRMSARIHAALPGSTGAIAAALITGDRGGISEDDESALRDAGLAHVLAIAGLHMALVGLGLFWFVRAGFALFPRIALTQPIKKWAAFAALAGAAFYLVISGAATPATRAFIMLAVMLVAVLFDRPALSMRSVALAATIILLLRPETLIEPGFQMSFAAVTGLVAVAEWERARHKEGADAMPLPTIRRYLRGIATTSFVGSIGTAPFAAFHFDRATHYAVLGNLAAMPIMGFVTMPAAALAVILMPFGLDAYPLHIMGWGIEAMLAIGRWVSKLPGSVSPVSAWPMSALLLLTFAGLWIGLWRQTWRWLGLVPAGLAALLISMTQGPDVLVARDGMTIAVRGVDGLLHFLRPPKDKYSAQEWLKRDGDARNFADAASPTARCDVYGCIAHAPNGTRIAATFRADGLDEDCAMNDIVLSAIPTRGRCHGPKLVIDRFDIARNGAYAIWLGDGIRVQTTGEIRGERPWSMPPSSQYRRTRPTSLPWTRTRSDP